MSKRPSGLRLSVKAEVKDFFAFVRAPSFSPRLPAKRAGDGWLIDWFGPLPVGRLVLWAVLLWLVNLFVLAPIAMAAVGAGGAQHRLNLTYLPWVQIVFWAPLIEEMVFRYGLRRPSQLFLLLPISIGCLFIGPEWYIQLLLALSLYLLISRSAWSASERLPRDASVAAFCWALVRGAPWRWASYKRYKRCFPWIFYGATLAFAALHLYNFKLNQAPWYLLPLFVLPQAVTGLVLGWVRIRRGIGAAIFLHAIFNAGPLLVLITLLRLAPDLTT